MKKNGILIMSIICFVLILPAYAEDGEALFKSHGCASCHKEEGTSRRNPSLTEISQAYQGKDAQLIQYLKGESEAIVRPAKSNLMKSKIAKTKNLSDTERKALADFILSH